MTFPKWIWLNGRLRRSDRPAISVFDRGFLYGDGVYETLKVSDGRPLFFREHVVRLRQSARGVGIALPCAPAALYRAVTAAARANRLLEAAVRVTLTRGPGPRGFDPRPAKRPTLAVTAFPLPPAPPATHERGWTVALARLRRNPPEALDPAVKSINNLNNILGLAEALRRGAREALFLNMDGWLAEGSASNVFFVDRGDVHTPSLDCGILAGVTRQAVIRLLRRGGRAVREGRFRPARLWKASEVFLTGTTLEVVPVTAIIDEKGARRRVGSGHPGPWTRRILEDYRAWVKKISQGGTSWIS